MLIVNFREYSDMNYMVFWNENLLSAIVVELTFEFFVSSVVITAPSDTKKPEKKDDELPVDIRLPVKHILSRELQVYDLSFSLLCVINSNYTQILQLLSCTTSIGAVIF